MFVGLFKKISTLVVIHESLVSEMSEPNWLKEFIVTKLYNIYTADEYDETPVYTFVQAFKGNAL